MHRLDRPARFDELSGEPIEQLGMRRLFAEVAEVKVEARFTPGEGAVTLTNPTDHLAFFLELNLVRGTSLDPVPAVLWDDNDISIPPHETRTLHVRFTGTDLKGEFFCNRRRFRRRQHGVRFLLRDLLCLSGGVRQVERNQGYRVLLNFVQGCRSLMVASTLGLCFRDTVALVSP